MYEILCPVTYYLILIYLLLMYFIKATKPDPNAPRPEGQTLRPVIGETLEVINVFSHIIYVRTTTGRGN